MKKRHIALLHEDLTAKLLDCYDKVFAWARQRPGYSEQNILEALVIELESRGLAVETQVEVKRMFGDKVVGTNRVDLLVAGEIPIEIKVVRRLTPRDENQMVTYLRDLKKPVGFLFNFGNTKMERRRVFEPTNAPK